jgi:hypothetical protein
MDETPAPLTFLVVAETSGYCDAETGLCISPETEAEAEAGGEADGSTPTPSETPEPLAEPAV